MKLGDQVKVSIYTNDPLKRQGQTGTITDITVEDEGNSLVEVQFTDGIKGAYYNNCLTPINIKQQKMNSKVAQRKFYKSLISNEFVRIDSFNAPDDPIGVYFYYFENYVCVSPNTALHMFFDIGTFKEITEKEFYTALDLAREEFIKSFKAVRGGIL